MTTNNTTGKLFTRNVPGITQDGRKLVIVTGVLALPADALTDEDMYIVYGNYQAGLLWGSLNIRYDSNVRKLTEGDTPDGILQLPIWQY